jgi:hypothetical protein
VGRWVVTESPTGPVPSPISIPGDEAGPFEHQCQRSPRQLTSEYGEGLYFNEGLEFAILCMEMGRFVIAEVHSNHNPKESSYLGHSFLILPSPAYAPSDTRIGRGVTLLVIASCFDTMSSAAVI